MDLVLGDKFSYRCMKTEKTFYEFIDTINPKNGLKQKLLTISIESYCHCSTFSIIVLKLRTFSVYYHFRSKQIYCILFCIRMIFWKKSQHAPNFVVGIGGWLLFERKLFHQYERPLCSALRENLWQGKT